MITEIFFFQGFIVAAFIAVAEGNGETQMRTQPKTITKTVGERAQFECHVLNVKTNQQVIWHFVDHNTTISTGDTIRAGNGFENKYSIYHPQDVADGTYWNLAISSVNSFDVGTYQCFVNGTNPLVKVTHHLEIEDLPSKPPAPNFNVTDCCKKEGVEKCALPLCDTSTSLNDVLMIVNNDTCMENNLIQVLRCGQDGRNHLGCCMRSGMSDLCLNLCDGYGEADGTDYSSCIGLQTLSLVQCLKEGQLLLPSRPTAVSAINLGNKIMVTWQPPDDNVYVVTGYKVQYRKAGEDLFNSKSPVSMTTYQTTVSGLQLNTIYEVRVIALASSGASQPSYTVDIATGVVDSASTRNDTIEDCCIKENVSSECQRFCSAGMFYLEGDLEAMYKCHSQLNSMYKCLVGYGNHTPCCERVQVPENCYHLCQGEVDISWDIMSCMASLPLISACVIEGSAILPDPPKNTRIVDGSVTSDSAVIAWDKPDNFKPGETYVVSWRLYHSDIPQWDSANVISGTSFQITNLTPATIYNVIVSTVNDKGSSLPELTLILVTEGVTGDDTTPFNETECCVEKGVPPECLDLCVHEFRLNDSIIQLGLDCHEVLGSMLLCATDGRDHTNCCNKIQDLPDDCLDLCSLKQESDVGTQFIGCLGFKDELSKCFDEGKDVLPLVPKEVSVKAMDAYSITIDWQRPSGPNVTSFLVQQSLELKYWEDGMTVTQTFAVVEDLMPDTAYYFRVLAVNSGGQSFPSNVVKAITKPVVVNGTHGRNWMMLWNSKAECCANSSNITICQKGCTNAMDIDLLQCATDLDRIVACGADGRDHTQCCSRYPEFPEDCLPYCRGQPGTRDVQSALCLHYIGAMFACFTEGIGVIPSPPQSVKAASSTSTSIKMKWTAPSDNCDDGCSYFALLWSDKTQELKYKIATDDTIIDFNKLEPETQYRVSVTASNTYGSSLPSPYVILMTLSDVAGTVSVSQYPPGVVDSGTSVQLGCAGLGAEITSVKWLRYKQTVKGTNLYDIKKVSTADSGLYTCSVTFAEKFKKKTKDIYLNVRFTPHPIRMNSSSVLPSVRQNADLACVFEGFPDIVTWTKDGHSLQGGSKYIIPTLVYSIKDGTTTSTLRVNKVVSTDFGTYTCNATNKFGSNSITGKLENDFPGTNLPPSVPPEEDKVRECCKDKNVPETCAERICRYAIDINAVISDPTLFYCLDYLEEFFACGADGKNHSKCCTQGGVVDFCLPFCAGKLPQHDNATELLYCMPHAETMLNCAVNAQQYVPAAPTNVRAKLHYDTVEVFWDYGENADRVDVYHIWYQTPSQSKDFDGAIRTARSYILPASVVKKGETITVWIVSQNDYGSSHPSENATVRITSLVPKMPTNLHGDLIDATSIDLKWDAPTTPLRIVKYSVFFHRIGDKETVVNTVSSKTRLIKLMPKTKYAIHVAAVSADGIGQKSNYIFITTGKATGVITDTSGKTGSPRETTGIVVGVILGVCFLIAVIIVAVLLFRRLRVPPPQQRHETVSFENPQYASGQRVSGLPGESEENNQFEYGKLHEERDNQHDYVTLEPQQTPQQMESSDAPATLNVDQA